MSASPLVLEDKQLPLGEGQFLGMENHVLHEGSQMPTALGLVTLIEEQV